MEKSDEEFELAKRTHQRNEQQTDFFNSAAIESGNIAVRSLFLINGGSVVALLAFLSGSNAQVLENSFADISESLLLFAYGVAGATICSLLTYLVSYCHAAIVTSVQCVWDHPYIENTKGFEPWAFVADTLHLVALAAAASSLTFFLVRGT